MADEILKQGRGYMISQSDIAATAVPYGPADREDGDRNYGFVDLRDQPDLVDEIPEAKKSDGLAELLRAINAPGSALMSIGCECGAFSQEAAQEGGPTRYIGSYVAITFRDPGRNSEPKALIDLARAILGRVRIDERHIVTFEMILEPLKHFFGRSGCFELLVKPAGRGRCDQEAWEAFDHVTFATAAAIRRLQEEATSTD